MTPDRVAYVVNMFPKVSETFIAGELADLRRRGVDVRVLSLHEPTESLRHDVVARAGLDMRTFYNHGEFLPALRTFRPQVLHAHFATEAAAAALSLAEELDVPFTFTTHGYDVYRRPPHDFTARAAAARAVVTVSQANARHIVDHFGVPPDRVHVISCGVDTERFQPNGERAEPPHVVCVARLAPVKNLGLLLQVCADLVRRGLDFRCIIIGDGRCREQLAAARSQLRLDPVVELLGSVEQSHVLQWWQRAAVAALSSQSEGMPVSLMEAAACGAPAVATSVGGVPELIEHGVTGLVVPPDDPRAMADAIERLLRDPVLRARMGRAARCRAKQRFSVRTQVNRLCDLWAAILSERGVPCRFP
jgi:glycosyltransferase involved in cell wall biosynthesis